MPNHSRDPAYLGPATSGDTTSREKEWCLKSRATMSANAAALIAFWEAQGGMGDPPGMRTAAAREGRKKAQRGLTKLAGERCQLKIDLRAELRDAARDAVAEELVAMAFGRETEDEAFKPLRAADCLAVDESGNGILSMVLPEAWESFQFWDVMIVPFRSVRGHTCTPALPASPH